MEVEDSNISQSHRINKAMELLHVKPSVLRELFDDQKSGRYTRILELFRSALDERTLYFERTRKAKTKNDQKKSRRKSIFHVQLGLMEAELKPMKKDELSFVHEAFQYLCKTFVGEVITNTEANKKPPYLKTDIIKSEMIADANADSGTTKSKKKKKSSTINSEDMKVQFTDDLLNPHDEATTTEKLKKYSNFKKFRAKRKKRDASEGKTFLDFNKKGGNEEIQELSSILRISDINDQRTEDAENEPAKTKDIVAESIDKCDNIFMIQGDDYYDQLERKLNREKAAQDFEELVAAIMKKDEKPVESSSESDDPDCADGLKFEFKVEISRMKPRNGKLPQTDKEIQRMKRIKKWMEKTGE